MNIFIFMVANFCKFSSGHFAGINFHSCIKYCLIVLKINFTETIYHSIYFSCFSVFWEQHTPGLLPMNQHLTREIALPIIQWEYMYGQFVSLQPSSCKLIILLVTPNTSNAKITNIAPMVVLNKHEVACADVLCISPVVHEVDIREQPKLLIMYGSST